MKLAIAIPNTGTIKAKTVFCLFRLLKGFPYDYTVLFKEGCIIHWNREALVKKAIETKCTHLLFIDSDMVFEKDAVIRLLDRKKDIVGVHYNLRQSPPTSTVKMSKETKLKLKEHDGFLTCDSVATGFLLIKLNVFKKLKEPWFLFESDDKGEIKKGEDYYFCEKAKKAGFKIWVDLTVPIGHIGDFVF